jgi:hypothetical protein
MGFRNTLDYVLHRGNSVLTCWFNDVWVQVPHDESGSYRDSFKRIGGGDGVELGLVWDRIQEGRVCLTKDESVGGPRTKPYDYLSRSTFLRVGPLSLFSDVFLEYQSPFRLTLGMYPPPWDELASLLVQVLFCASFCSSLVPPLYCATNLPKLNIYGRVPPQRDFVLANP